MDAIVLLNDDSERLPYVKDATAAFVLPLHARQSNVALYEALQEVLGPDRVMRVSEAKIVLDFDQVDPDIPLLDYLLHELESVRPNIRSDLAALIAFGGKAAMDPRKETFRDKWAQFHDTRIRRGHRIFPCSRSYLSAHFERRSLLRLNPAALPLSGSTRFAITCTWGCPSR